MRDESGPAKRQAPRWRERFGSLTPGARPKSLWLTYLVVALIGLGGVAFLVLV